MLVHGGSVQVEGSIDWILPRKPTSRALLPRGDTLVGVLYYVTEGVDQ